jgi:hypothetical protein
MPPRRRVKSDRPNRPVSEPTQPDLGRASGEALDSECPFSPMSLHESAFRTLSIKVFAGSRQASFTDQMAPRRNHAAETR